MVEGVARLFLAVDLPDEVRYGLAAHLAGALGGKALPGKPVPPQNWHLTLRFLGSTDPVLAERLCAEVDQADLGGPLAARLGGLGAFPRASRASVLWIGIEDGAERLTRLAASVEESVRAVGFEPEERPFRSHLTLSRLRPDQDVRPILEMVPSFPVRFDIDEVVLYRSRLGRPAAHYEALERFPLT